jgi:hypothetical protein
MAALDDYDGRNHCPGYTPAYKENTRQEYDRKRTSFTKAVLNDRLRQSYKIVFHRIRSWLIDLGRKSNDFYQHTQVFTIRNPTTTILN